MLNILPAPIKAILSLLLYAANTLLWLPLVLLFSLLKMLLPFAPWQRLMSHALDAMASNWIAINTLNQKLFSKVKINATGLDNLQKQGWYLVISNHQSWVDILVLQRVLLGKVPFLKFFLKKQLIYVPFLGLAWWALDFPFMKRYSSAFLKKHPHLKGKDIETTRKACRKFRHKPVSIMNFLEGTRFTAKKHRLQQSPFKHLLKPKAGGIAFVLDAMGGQLNKIVDVTIHYPQGIPTFIDYVSGKVRQVNVSVRTFNIDKSLIGDYFNDQQFKAHFQHWVNQLWLEKDAQLHELSRQQ